MTYRAARNEFGLAPGQWTDDAAMGLCLADTILLRGRYDGSDFRARLWSWWFRGYNNAFRRDPSRAVSVGLGRNVADALFALAPGEAPAARYEASTQDSGNGPLIRLAAVPARFHRDAAAAAAWGALERCRRWRDRALDIEGTIARRGERYNGYPVLREYFGAYGLDGLALALHAVSRTRSFDEAVVRCANHLGDADSTAAIAGQIAGALYGYSAIDPRLLARLARWDGGETALRGALLYGLGSVDEAPVPNEARPATP